MVNYSLVNLVQYQDIASNGNTLRGHHTEFRLLHVKRLISDYAQVVIVARTTEWLKFGTGRHMDRPCRLYSSASIVIV